MEKVECRIEYEHRMNDEMLQALHMLYAPMMQMGAISLYETMYALAISNVQSTNHSLILKCHHISSEKFHKLRLELERFQLLKTYHHKQNNEYLYVLCAPKIGYDFLNDAIFGRMYLKECGQAMYEWMKQAMQNVKTSKEDYENISAPLKLTFAYQWNEEDEKNYDAMQEQRIPERIDEKYLTILNNLSLLVLPMSARTPQNLQYIAKWSSLYGLNEVQVGRAVSRAMDYPTNSFYQERFLTYIRNVHGSFEIDLNKDQYDCSPIEFLRRRQQGIDLSLSDKKIIELLVDHYRLPHDVINVMIEYVLDKNNQNLNKNYIEKVASSWVRLKIDTKEKALSHIRGGYQNNQVKEDWLDRMQQMNSQGEDDPEETRRLQAELAQMMAQIGGDAS